MKIEYLEPSKLIPYEFNNRRHDDQQIDRIANSIKEFGFTQPIVIDESNIILVGHGRWLAAQKLNLDKVPALIKSDLTETQKKAYRILDNKLQNDSTWDFNNLELELGHLEDLDFDLKAWGLDEIQSLIPGIQGEVIEDGGAGAIPEESYIKLGDLIELGNHRVLCGDSRNSIDCDNLLKSDIPEMCFTDPPYGVNYQGGHFHSGDVNIIRKREKLASDLNSSIYIDFLNQWINRIDGPFYVFHADSCPHELYSAIKKHDAEIHALIIWHKINATYAAMNAQYKQRHEPCLYFKPKGKTTRWTGPSDECTVWEEKRDSSNDLHPTQKPIILAARAIKNHNVKIIADPFLGGGATLMASEQLNRICYGMEIEPKYCQVTIERYKKYCTQVGKEFICKINGEPFNK